MADTKTDALIVFTPSGKRIDIAGADMEKLDKALAAK